MEWAPTKEWIKHGSPSLIRDMASTMRKVGQTLCKQSAPRRLVPNPATPTVRKVAGKPDVERAYMDPMSRAPIAHIPVRIGGTRKEMTRRSFHTLRAAKNCRTTPPYPRV
jgi:hypothetical protein